MGVTMKKLILLIFISNVLLIKSQNSEYIPFETQQTQYNQEYVPFSDGITYTLSNNKPDKNRCEYCGANMNADCHAHAKWCPYHCDDEDCNPVPLDFDISAFIFMLSLLGIYSIYKIPTGFKTSSVKG